MRTFFQSGGAFIVVALLCVVVGFISRSETVFTSIGAVWLMLAIIVRAKYTKKTPEDKS